MRHSLCFLRRLKRKGGSVGQRKHQRFEIFTRVHWDFFAQSSSKKSGYIGDISCSGCLLKTNEPIENQRWVRMLIQDDSSNLYVHAVGKIIRQRHMMEILEGGIDIALYQYGIEFTVPNYFSLGGADLILELSKRNLSVRSCLNLNSRSPILPGFLA